MDKFEVLLVELNFFVGLELLFFEFFNDCLDLVVFDGHEFEFFLIELDFREEFVVFLFFKFLVLVEVLVFALKTVVLFDEFFVGFF
jgi:hypothetical protein